MSLTVGMLLGEDSMSSEYVERIKKYSSYLLSEIAKYRQNSGQENLSGPLEKALERLKGDFPEVKHP